MHTKPQRPALPAGLLQIAPGKLVRADRIDAAEFTEAKGDDPAFLHLTVGGETFDLWGKPALAAWAWLNLYAAEIEPAEAPESAASRFQRELDAQTAAIRRTLDWASGCCSASRPIPADSIPLAPRDPYAAAYVVRDDNEADLAIAAHAATDSDADEL